MKWFKHDANATLDAKLQRVRLKYGLEGYGLYWFLLEAIARNVEKHNLTFELEGDAELIAASTGLHYERVQEMMTYMVNLGLFENSGGTITCLKMATRTDEYTQKLIQNMQRVPTISRQSPDSNGRKSELIEEKRREEKDIGPQAVSGASARFIPPDVGEVQDRISEMGYRHVTAGQFHSFYTSKGWKVGKSPMKDWRAALAGWESRAAGDAGKVAGKEFIR